jgi:hypothetical protein
MRTVDDSVRKLLFYNVRYIVIISPLTFYRFGCLVPIGGWDTEKLANLDFWELEDVVESGVTWRVETQVDAGAFVTVGAACVDLQGIPATVWAFESKISEAFAAAASTH